MGSHGPRIRTGPSPRPPGTVTTVGRVVVRAWCGQADGARPAAAAVCPRARVSTRPARWAPCRSLPRRQPQGTSFLPRNNDVADANACGIDVGTVSEAGSVSGRSRGAAGINRRWCAAARPNLIASPASAASRRAPARAGTPWSSRRPCRAPTRAGLPFPQSPSAEMGPLV